jgi:hypothetical protein
VQGVQNRSTDFLYVTVDLVILGFKAWSVSILLGFSTICNFMQNATESKLIERNLGKKIGILIYGVNQPAHS